MNIAYVANIRIPTEKAHGYQVLRVCAELSAQGQNVSLYVPSRKNAITEDPFVFYGIEKNFSLVQVPCFDWIRLVRFLGPLAFRLQTISFLKALRKKNISKDSVIYTRDAEAVWAFAKDGYVCVYNAHNWPARSARITKLLRGVRGVVCNSEGTAEAVRRDLATPVVVAQNASDQNLFVGTHKSVLRQELGLPQDAFIALYAGHLYGWKGAGVLFGAATVSPDITLALVGGTETDVARARKEYGGVQNILLLGHKPKKDIPKYLAAADVLVLPNTAQTEESVRFTSPLKLFEYMAAGVPIVASDLLSVRAIVSEREAFFFPAGDSQALSTQLAYVRGHVEEGKEKAARALELSRSYTWSAHAKKLADFLLSLR